MLAASYFEGLAEAGCDEAGRGCLAGSVFAAAVILPRGYSNARLDDSKRLSDRTRRELREEIRRDAAAWAVGAATAEEIDAMNILNASMLAMHRALDALKVRPEAVIVDGNRFAPYGGLPFRAIVKGDGKYMPIAAASILAKTCRDDCMEDLDRRFPQYMWRKNKGYPTAEHREAIRRYGLTPFHRKSFTLLRGAEAALLPGFGE